MRAKLLLKHSIRLVLLAVPLMILQLPLCNTLAEAQSPPSAVVIAAQGTAYVVGPEEAPQQLLSQGEAVPAWQTVRIDDNSRLLLQWEGDYFTSVGGNSTLFVSTRQIPEGLLTDVQLIEGVLRASSFGGGGKVSRPYALTTPVATVEPAALDTDVDFIVEVPEPAVTVLTVLKGSVRVKSLTAQGSEEVTVGSCQSVFVEEGKPVSNAAAVPAEALEKLVADTTIAGTELADVKVCGLGKVARQPLPAPAPPPDYSYVEDEYVDDYYPYDEIEVQPPTVAAGPMIIVLPGIGRWYLPYDVYHQWGFGPNLIRTYVSVVLCQNSLHYDYYYWNSLAVRQREYYDVLYPAQFANNTMLIAQTQNHLDFVRIRQNLMARRIQNLQARVGGLEQALSGRGAVRASVLNALYNSLNSPRNINVARSFRQGAESRLRIQEQLAGNASDELSSLRRRMAQARNPQERLHLRDQMSQLRNGIRAGKLPLPGKDRDIRNLLDQIPKARSPEQLNSIQNQLARQLGRPKVMAEPDIMDPKQLEGLARKIQKTASPEARIQVDKRLQDLQRNVRQRKEIESSQKEIDRVVSQAAKTENEAKRAELLRTVPGLVKTGQAPFKGALGDLREQQLLHSGIIGKPEKGKQEELDRRMRDFTKKQAEKVRPLVGRPTGELGRKVQGLPTADEAARKRSEDLKKQAEDARRKAEQMLKRKEIETRKGETQPALERDRQTKERLERSRQAEEALRRAQEKAKQGEQRKAVDVERLRKEKEGASQEAEIQRRRQEAIQKQKEEQAKQQRLKETQGEQRKAVDAERLRKEKERASRGAEIQRRQGAIQKQKEEQGRQQRLKEQQAEQTRRGDAERAKAQQQQRQLRLQQEQRRKADEGARDRQRQEQIRKQAEQARSRELERSRAQQSEQQMRQRQMQEQSARQQQMEQQKARQRQLQEQQIRQRQLQEQQIRQRQMQEQRMRQMQRPQQRGVQPGVQDPRRKTIPEQPGLPLR